MAIVVQREVECVTLSNQAIELALPITHGPRVARYARRGSVNVFAEVSPRVQAVKTPFGSDWHIYGGHRLWLAPEDAVASYYPDNVPVEVCSQGNTLTLTQPVEPHTGIEKRLSVQLHDDSSHVTVTHALTLRGAKPLHCAPWALSAMAPGGVGIFPQARFHPHPDALAPARPLVLWPFTRMNDPRFTWGDRFVLLRQHSAQVQPQKFGFYNDRGYMAYALGDVLFVKCHRPMAGSHADFGCNAQTFTNELFLELETLGPLLTLAPGQCVRHVEEWFLFDDFVGPVAEPTLAATLRPCLTQAAALLAAHGSNDPLCALLNAALEPA